ncbi:MAG: thioesterase family protein [Dehalococcoidia bacterium]|nr:thioesterase family protein [Dehalococcoidia bacterium]
MEQPPTTKAIEVRSTDVDADGIVNNAVFYQYCEQARLEHLARFHIIEPGSDRGPRPRRFTIAGNSCRYLAPVHFRETVLVEVSTARIGRTSFTLAYRLLNEADGTLLAESESTQVWLDEDGRPAPFPPEVRVALEASSEEPADTASP